MAIPNKVSQVKSLILQGEYPLDIPSVDTASSIRVPGLAEWNQKMAAWYYDFKTVIRRKEDDLQKTYNTQMAGLNAFRTSTEERLLAIEAQLKKIPEPIVTDPFPSQLGNAGKVLTTNGFVVSWERAIGVGTVTRVNIESADLSVDGSPITTSGTIELTLRTVPVGKGGTGVTTFAAGVVIAPGGTTALTSITGNPWYLPRWAVDTLANSALYQSGTDLTQEGSTYTIESLAAFGASPLATWKGNGQYNTALDVITFGQIEIGKENVSDGNTAGILNLRTRTDGGSNTTRLSISSTGAITLSQLTASKFVKTDASKVLTSTDIAASDIISGAALTAGTPAVGTNVTLTVSAGGAAALLAATSLTPVWTGYLGVDKGGSGAGTANDALNAFLPTQGASAGKFLKTDGTNTSWASETVVGEALTRVSDTNVTLTFTGGSSSTALVNATEITAGWSGLLSVARGGTAGGTPDDALAQLLPSQVANAGKVLSTNGTVTSWIAAGSAGTVTSVSIGAPAAGITQSGSPITASGTITLALANDLAALEALTGTGIAKRTGVDTWALQSFVLATDGGTGQTGYAIGDMLYASSTTALSRRNIGINKSVMTSDGTAPQWTTTLQVDNGGTGITTTSAGGLIYGVTTSLLGTRAIGAANYVLISDGSAPQWTSALGRVSGGTGITTYAKGDLIYANAINNLANRAIGTVNQVLTVDATGVPVWAASPGGVGTVTSIAISSTDLSVSGSPITSSGTFTLNINTAAVTLAKMANMATASFLGRNTAATGVPEVLSMATARTMLGVAELTTKGDLLGFSTVPERIPISTDGFVLMADSTQALGLKWAAAGGAGTVTSVGLTSSDITVGGSASPITGAGTFTLTLNTVGVSKGGTGVATMTAGVVISPGGTTALSTVTGTADVLPKWGTNTLVPSLLSDTGSDAVILTGARLYIKSTEAYNSDPQSFLTFAGQYDSGGVSYATMVEMISSKENATDGNDAGKWELQTKPNGGAITTRLSVSSTGVINVSNLTASRPVYTDASKNLVSATVQIADGGTGAITANLGLNALLPSQAAHPGKVLQTDGTNASWIATGGTGSVTGVTVGNLSPLFTSSVATPTTTPAVTFALDTQTANLVFAGPASGGAVAPTFRALVSDDIPVLNASKITTGSLDATVGGTMATTVALGDILYGSATNVWSRRTGNTAADKKFLSMTGTGAAAAAPSWSLISGSDITGAVLSTSTSSNVNLVLTGAPTTALLTAANIQATWTGQLSIARGGTGEASKGAAMDALSPVTTVGDLIYRNISTNARLPIGTSGQVLKTSAFGVPAWGQVAYSELTGTPPSGDITNGSASFATSPGSCTVTAYALVNFGGGAAGDFSIEISGSGTFELKAHVHFSTGASSLGDTCYAKFNGVAYTERVVSTATAGCELQVVLGATVVQAGTTTYQVYAKGITGSVGTFSVNNTYSWISYLKLES